MAGKSRSRTPVSKATPTKKSATKSAKAPASRSKTPVAKKVQPKRSASNSRAATPVKTAQKSASKGEGSRKFYTVAEDWAIWQAFRAGSSSGSTVSEMAKTLAAKLKRSEESVRDRIKRYISKLGDNQEAKLLKAAKDTPNWHVHFANDKKGPPFKVISSITCDDPGVNFKQSSAKRAPTASPAPVAKAPSPKKPSPSKSPAPKKSALAKRSPSKSSRSNTPSKPVKKVKAAEKSPKPVAAPKNDSHGELRGKVSSFLGGLDSKKPDDVRRNAEVLAEVVKGFSSSYGVELSDVMNLLAKGNAVNCADVRTRLSKM